MEGDVQYRYRRGNIIQIFKFHGIPINDLSVGATNMSLSPFQIRGVQSTYYSWYNMDDAVPTSALLNNIPRNKAANMAGNNPTYANAIWQVVAEDMEPTSVRVVTA